MSASPTNLLRLYGALTATAALLAPLYLHLRALHGKEDRARLAERFGRDAGPRPEGKLVWLHGASVGETRVTLTLAAALAAARPDNNLLLTTQTRTGADVAQAGLPPRAAHRFAPIDSPGAARCFLDHWRPDLAVFTESELWPALIGALSERGTKLALVNARMSGRSLRRWARRAPDSAAFLLSRFAWIGAADTATAGGLAGLSGRAVERTGNVKLDALALDHDAPALAALKTAIGGRAVWCAASTHKGEEEIVLSAHEALRFGAPDALLILVPRHPARGDAVEALIRARGFSVARRSRNEPPGPGVDVYLADTIGEMGVLLRAAPLALLGGSLVSRIGGHNPAEPVQAGAVLLSGPHVSNFAEAYDEFAARGGARIVADAAALARALAALLVDPERRAAMCAAADSVLAESGGAAARTVAALLTLLDEETP